MRPGLGAVCPRGKVVPGRKRPCRVEDRESSGEKGKNDQAAAEVDAAQNHLCHPYTGFDFLVAMHVRILMGVAGGIDELTMSLA